MPVALPDVRFVDKHTTQTIPHGAIPRQIDLRWRNSAPVPNNQTLQQRQLL